MFPTRQDMGTQINVALTGEGVTLNKRTAILKYKRDLTSLAVPADLIESHN